MKNPVNAQPSGEDKPTEASNEQAEQKPGYQADGKFAFDPMKELNLPANYDEVLARFKRLQGSKAMESLN